MLSVFPFRCLRFALRALRLALFFPHPRHPPNQRLFFRFPLSALRFASASVLPRTPISVFCRLAFFSGLGKIAYNLSEIE